MARILILCLLIIALVLHGLPRESSIVVMPAKKKSEKITEELRELRLYVEEHAETQRSRLHVVDCMVAHRAVHDTMRFLLK